MNKIYILIGIIGTAFVLVSNSSNPPDGHTGAPGELFCANCHSSNGTPNTGTITVEGFPASITPEETYALTVVNTNTNDGAVKGGFQITILGPFNTKAGEMSMPSENSALAMLSGRQYFEHHPAVNYDSTNILKWTVLWKAPTIDSGSLITWYANGIVANGNAKETGDKVISARGSGTVLLSATENIAIDKPSIYPNPGSDEIHIRLSGQTISAGHVRFFDTAGRLVYEAEIEEGAVNASYLPIGFYLMELRHGQQTHVARWSKI